MFTFLLYLWIFKLCDYMWWIVTFFILVLNDFVFIVIAMNGYE
jgi:hypothetical protein